VVIAVYSPGVNPEPGTQDSDAKEKVMHSSKAPSVTQLREVLQGEVIGPDDPGYDDARAVFYGIDRKPAAIARPTTADEVARIVSIARDTGTKLAVRSGGHSLAGYSVSEGGLVLDLSALKTTEIDEENRTVWAQTGLTARELTNALGEHGLAVGFGDTGTVGIGGLTLGGGAGFLSRKYGLTIDSLLAAEVVTADGKVTLVDADNHPDLFWAIRGGGGNFGVATRFLFQAAEVPEIVGGMLILSATTENIVSFVELADAAPEELTTILNVMKAPPMPFLPEDLVGQPIIFSLLVYAGDAETGEKVVAPFRNLDTPLLDMVQPGTYAGIYEEEEEEGAPPFIFAIRNFFANDIDETSATSIVEALDTSTAPMAVAQIRVLGGAVGRVPNDATAYGHRSHPIMVNVASAYADPEEAGAHESWVNDLSKVLGNGADDAYVNFLGEVDEARVRQAYPAETWERLKEVKRRYDPGNLFRLNQNIPPAGG
jgi:FAD/FMN-containing dehydrogenase